MGKTSTLRELQERWLLADMLTHSLGLQQHDFKANPYSRVHQEKLLRFRDEVSCVQKVLHDQREKMVDLKNIAWPAKAVRSTMGLAYDYVTLSDCISSTNERILSFEDMNARAINIGIYVSLQPSRTSPHLSRLPGHTNESTKRVLVKP